MFVRIASDDAEMVTVSFQNQTLKVRKGLTVAAALLEAGIHHFRDTPVTGAPRAPFCMMGVCFDCLVVIDGLANQQSCLIEVREGMRIERQDGLAGFEIETLPEQEQNK